MKKLVALLILENNYVVSFFKNEDNDALANRPQNCPSLMESHSGAPYKARANADWHFQQGKVK